MALSSTQKQIVWRNFLKIVKDPDTLFNWFVPNTKAQMIALIEAQVAAEKTQLETNLANIPTEAAATEARLQADIAVLEDLMAQL